VLAAEETVRRQDALPTYRWTHLAARTATAKWVCNVNGRLAASAAATGAIVLPDRDVLVGLNGDPQRVSDPVSHSAFAAANNLPLVYGIEGLIDEVMIYDRALTAAEIRRSFREFCPPEEALGRPDLEKRVLPGAVDGQPASAFGAACRNVEVSRAVGQPLAARRVSRHRRRLRQPARAAWCSGRGRISARAG